MSKKVKILDKKLKLSHKSHNHDLIKDKNMRFYEKRLKLWHKKTELLNKTHNYEIKIIWSFFFKSMRWKVRTVK